jgi:integrase
VGARRSERDGSDAGGAGPAPRTRDLRRDRPETGVQFGEISDARCLGRPTTVGFSGLFATPSATPRPSLLRCYSGRRALMMMTMRVDTDTPNPPRSWLMVATTRQGELVYEAGWRHHLADGGMRTMKRRIGPAWLERASGDGVVRRRGRVKPGFFDEHAAIVAKDQLVRRVERDLAQRVADAKRVADAPVTFREIAHAYLDWLARVRDAKPATLRDHRYLLAEPGAAYRRGSGVHAGVIIGALGDHAAAEVTTRQINELLDGIAATGIAARTVNKHRRLICAIYNYAARAATFQLEENPGAMSDRRPEPERARLDYFSPEEVERLARALEDGAHRDVSRVAVETSEIDARTGEDRQDGDLVRVAAYTGLRRGELVALRWSDIDIPRRKVIVRRAVSADEETPSTKSRRAREVPIPDQAATALRRLVNRADFTTANDFVFVNRLGRRLDASALRRRVERARDAAGLHKLRFHDLRHTYGSLLVAGGVDLAAVKSAMGHSRITTTERYLHARSASELADRFTQALGST